MLIAPESLKEVLRRPLGPLMDIYAFAQKYQGNRIIAVGDIVVLSLLKIGVRPFVSVYDLKSRRVELGAEERKHLENEYPKPILVRNPPGTITEELLFVAKITAVKGGAVLIDGEEDMASLAFMAECENGVIVYGQPGEGVVAVECGKKNKKLALEL
ncbi:MAG: DUF359 domain-containing protein, partial [Candidatus Paceibacteria bacterium]